MGMGMGMGKEIGINTHVGVGLGVGRLSGGSQKLLQKNPELSDGTQHHRICHTKDWGLLSGRGQAIG